MPAMPRPSRKATKIAFAILGTPANYVEHKKNTKREKRLVFEETSRVR